MCFRLAPSNLTLNGSKIKVSLLYVKYAENGKSYDVGPTGIYSVPMDFTLDDLHRLKVKITK